MFVFGIALTVGGFVPEAIKAKRIISQALHDTTIKSLRRPAH
jgi:hypothetical protein